MQSVFVVKWAPALAAALLAASSWAQAGEAYPNTSGMGGMFSKDDPWYQACMQVKDVQPPPTDLPATKPGDLCKTEDLYYVIKNKPDRSAADWQLVRHCALAEKDHAVLMMLYANGFGVPRNLKLATHYACSLDDAHAEVQARVLQLDRMLDDPDYESNFDQCDDFTSGYMQGLCAGIAERQKQRERRARLVTLTGHWSALEKSSLSKLEAFQKQFQGLRGSEETDASGTARAAQAIETQSAEADVFMEDLIRVDGGTYPGPASASALIAYDKALNEAYQKIMKNPKAGTDDRLGLSTVTKAGVRNTQRAWLRYRDAWMDLARARRPSTNADAVKYLLTERRTKQLEELQLMLE